jgi:hypothetical protein
MWHDFSNKTGSTKIRNEEANMLFPATITLLIVAVTVIGTAAVRAFRAEGSAVASASTAPARATIESLNDAYGRTA